MNSLAKLSNNRYKIALDESWHHERPEVRNPDRIWYERIPCKGEAFISIFSIDPLILHLWTDRVKSAKIIWEAIKDAAGVWADFHFDGEAVIYFPLQSLPQVARLAGARKRRKLSEGHRMKLAEAGMAHWFKPKNDGSNLTESGGDFDVLVEFLLTPTPSERAP